MIGFAIALLFGMAFAADSSSVTSSVTSAAAEATSTAGELTYEKLAEMSLKERLLAYPWQLERYSVGFVIGYLIVFTLGSKYNRKMVDKFVNAILPALKDNFFQVGVTKSKLLAQDDQQHFTLYATGRLRVESMISRIVLQARQNPLMWIMEYGTGFFFDSIPYPEDKVTVEFKLDEDASSKFDNFIWAVVTKDHMNDYRKENYYLSLTKTAENPDLPPEFVFMNEVPEMNKVLYSKKLQSLLTKSKNFLQFFAITDQPSDKPENLSELKPKKKFVLQMSLPRSDSDLAAVKEFVTFLLNEYIDHVCRKAVFRPELSKKCKKTREVEYSKLQKLLEEERKEKLNSDKTERERARISKLSPNQQEKLLKKQEKRKQRRAMNKQKVRM